MFLIFNKTDNVMVSPTPYLTLTKAMEICRNLTNTYRKNYVVFAPVYDSESYRDERTLEAMAADAAKYGSD